MVFIVTTIEIIVTMMETTVKIIPNMSIIGIALLYR